MIIGDDEGDNKLWWYKLVKVRGNFLQYFFKDFVRSLYAMDR